MARAPDVILELRADEVLAGGGARSWSGTGANSASVPAVRYGRIHVIGGDSRGDAGAAPAALVRRDAGGAGKGSKCSLKPCSTARGLTWSADGRTILGPVDLEVRRGECLVVVGPNGAGKTTLLRSLTGLLRPASGEVAYGGHPFSSLSRRELARRIAYVPQIRPSRVPLTVEEVVLLGRYPHLSAFQLAPAREDFAAVETALDLVGDRRTCAAGRWTSCRAASGRRPSSRPRWRRRRSCWSWTSPRSTSTRATRATSRGCSCAWRPSPGARWCSPRTISTWPPCSATGCWPSPPAASWPSGPPAEILRPDLLERLFRARFEVVRGGERPVTLLQLGP